MVDKVGPQLAVLYSLIVCIYCALPIDVPDHFDGSKTVSIDLDNENAYNEETTNSSCKISLGKHSKMYFRRKLEIEEPNIIYFIIVFKGSQPNCTKETLYPTKWVWTYSSSKGVYPYLNWNIDYDIFSFDLLDVRTLRPMPYIKLHVTDSCNLTLGTRDTTEKIVDQLKLMVDNSKPVFKKYQTNYWCYLAEAPGIRHTAKYYLGLYLSYPVDFIKYNCCITYLNYSTEQFASKCYDKQTRKWPQCTVLPYFLGVLICLYWPIVLLEIAAFLSKHEHVQVEESSTQGRSEASPLLETMNNTMDEHRVDSEDTDIIYLDGSTPFGFTDIFRKLFQCVPPVAGSRIRRFVLVLLFPFAIYIRLAIYARIQFKTTTDLIERGAPSGFLSLLAKTKEGQVKSFVPALGGPWTIAGIFYVFGVLMIVLPKSFKGVIQFVLPTAENTWSPLCFNYKQVCKMSGTPISNVQGYKNVSQHFRCSFYMLFTTTFWKKAFHIQTTRYTRFFVGTTGFCAKLCICMLPLYIVVCFLELSLCLVYYSIPLAALIVLSVRGTTKFLTGKVKRSGHFGESLMKYKAIVTLFTFTVVTAVIFYAYSFCLVFIESFYFLTEFLIYSYLAVIMYPAISFGYLFSSIVLLYYIFHLVRGFGDRYLELLDEVIEIVMMLVRNDNHVTNLDGHLLITNLRISTVKSITINRKKLPLARNILNASDQNESTEQRLRYKNNVYGIHKDLFEYVVKEHQPVHQQVLKIFFQLFLIFVLLIITISMTVGFKTGPTSEMADVMHVVFIVTIGALPRILEITLVDSSERIVRDIRLRSLEETINRYWRDSEITELREYV